MRVSQFKNHVDSLLSRGLDELSMTLGVLARIENNNYEIVAVQSNSGAYVSGEKFELGQSFSREVFEDQRVIADNSINNSPPTLLHPLYRSLPLESYIGAPIVLRGEPWGCIDFSSMAQREEDFDAPELKLVENIAGEISQLLSSIDDGRSAGL